jgi:hypothetical protein
LASRGFASNGIGFKKYAAWLCILILALAPAQPVMGVTLQDLFHGSALHFGTTRFSDWQLISIDSTTPPNPDLSLITVTPIGSELHSPGFQLNANGQLATAGINAIDLTLRFRASSLATDVVFTSHTVELTGINFASNGGIGFVSTEVDTGPSGQNLSSVAIVDHESEFVQLAQTAALIPDSDVFITANVFITGLSGSDSVNLSTFTSRFAQVGPQTLLGDYNENGIVDAADYSTWRNNVGTTNPLANDAIGGRIGSAHYQQWRTRLGHSDSSGAGLGSGIPTPEPAALPIVGIVLIALSRRWRQSTLPIL